MRVDWSLRLLRNMLGHLTLLNIRGRRGRGIVCRHEVRTHASSTTGDWLEIRTPLLELLLGIAQNLSRIVAVGEGLSLIARDDRSVVEEVEKPAAILGENDLLLCSLDGCGKVDVICFLNLLAGLDWT